MQAVFPPPEINQIQKDKQRSQKMHPIDLELRRVLDDARHAT
jgi:hypothetical protein